MAEVIFISDVHSNLEALEAVLSEIKGKPLYCLGDLVGYGPNPNEVVALLKDANAVCLMGNHDYASVTGETAYFNARAAMSALWTKKTLTEENASFLAGLPRRVRLEIGGVRVFLTHGSPNDNLWEYVRIDTHDGLFGHYLRALDAGAVGLGHTHVPFVWTGAEGFVFNPGSVGQPRDGDPKASYAIASFEGGRTLIEHGKITYDIETVANKIRKAGLPEQNASRLFVGF